MSTSTPKNYITTGISKTLLTPCRRVGLSRSKKKPKNDTASPLILSPNRAGVTPVKEINIHEMEKNLVLVETPKRNLPTKLADTSRDTSILRSTNKNKIKSKIEKPDKASNLLDHFTESDTVILRKNKNQSSVKEITQDVATKTIVTVEVHHPVAKRTINFNTPNNSPVVNNQVNNSSPLGSPTFPIIDEKSTIHTTEKMVAVTKDNKRKLSIDSDDFTENINIVGSKNLPENNLIYKNAKKSRMLSNNSSGITLARFTTDDYLKEYTINPSINPKIFEENLEKESLASTTTYDVNTNEINASKTSFCNTSKENDEEKQNVKSPIISKKQVPILCPTNDNNSKKVQRSLSLKKITKDKKSTREEDVAAEDITPKSKLTVSLERLKTDNLKTKQKKADINKIQLKKAPSNVSPVNCIVKYSKINIDDDDEELFTSSPVDDKKQRENLVKLISDIEIEIKQKEEKLEKLKQAEVYKNKHSPEKVKIFSDKWLKGCRTGLDDLLAKMKEHGPMEMDTLVKKLGIPDNILNCLNINS